MTLALAAAGFAILIGAIVAAARSRSKGKDSDD